MAGALFWEELSQEQTALDKHLEQETEFGRILLQRVGDGLAECSIDAASSHCAVVDMQDTHEERHIVFVAINQLYFLVGIADRLGVAFVVFCSADVLADGAR